MPTAYDRHRRDREVESWGDRASSGAPLAPRRPLVWLVVQFVRLVRRLIHRTLYGALATTPGRVVSFAVAVWVLGHATVGAAAPLVGYLPHALVGSTIAGFFAYRKRRTWEDRVANAVYHSIPGHSRMEPEVLFFGAPGIAGRLNLGRWAGSWNFGFRLPAANREADTEEIAEHMRERLPAAHGASWKLRWDLRAGSGYAELVPDMPEFATRPAGEVSADPGLVPLGQSLSGEASWPLDANFGNILVTGGPGGGKSVVVNGIVRHCLEHPDSFVLYAVDMKGGVELAHLEKHETVREVAEDLDASLELLQSLREEVDVRQAALKASGTKKIDDMNKVRKARGEKPYKRLVLLVDELAELTDVPDTPGASPEEKEERQKRGEAKALLDSIIRLGRAGGTHVVAALQRPDIRYMTGAMRSNIQMRVATGRLDQSGCQMLESKLAGDLPGVPGRGVLWRGGQEEVVQFYFTADEDLEEVLANSGEAS